MNNAVYKHMFIIPNYCEPIHLLKSTIDKLVEHSCAQTHYCIILAMEESEVGFMEKANELLKLYRKDFKEFIITAHPKGVAGEAKGKGSNVNFAVRDATRLLLKNGYVLEDIVVTVCDSDAHISEMYVEAIEQQMQILEDKHYTVFCPPIFLGRNCHQVPAAVRTTDVMWSSMVMQNLSNFGNIMFPCSTYSLPLVLVDKVDYWDPGFEAVGEDMHMMLKCFFATQGRAKACPIYIPINLTNVQSDTYLSSFYARFTQAKRHYFGSHDVNYALTHTFAPTTNSYSRSSLKRVLICYHVFEAHLVPSVTGLISVLAIPLCELNNVPTRLFPSYASIYSSSKFLAIISIVPIILTLFTYHALHGFIERRLLKQKSVRSWIHLLDVCVLPISGIFLMTLPSCVSALRRFVVKEETYIVSEKKIAFD